MNLGEIKLFIEQRLYEDSYALYGRIKTSSGHKVICKPALEDTKEGLPIEPFMQLAPEEVQGLFNKLWALGFRPKDGTGNSGHIEALKYHLEDMRNLVFKANPRKTR